MSFELRANSIAHHPFPGNWKPVTGNWQPEPNIVHYQSSIINFPR